MTDEIKICKDCKHFIDNKAESIVVAWFAPGVSAPYLCARAKEIDIVDGGVSHRACNVERHRNTDCGPEGKLWEAKE